MRIVLSLLALLPFILAAPSDDLFQPKNGGKIWAVLVAGSYTWDNYRHQADICHAYQIFRRHGIPDENIIVMMYDDIANNPSNPTPGVIINKPDGPNVYVDVPKDYNGDDVTSTNFFNVIMGDKESMKGIGSGKVLESGPNDNVFINFVDHGSPGYICFPDDDVLYADDLVESLQWMSNNKMFNKLVFYLESCESGSMFENLLPDNTKIFASTAANPHESSWGYYCDNELYTCLGDLYSIAWMEDVDRLEKKRAQSKETLIKQFSIVKKRTNKSHPQVYGDMSLKKNKVADFMGISSGASWAGEETEVEVNAEEGIPSRNITLVSLERHIAVAKERGIDKKELKKLQERRTNIIQGRKMIDNVVNHILSAITHNNADDMQNIVEKHLPITKNIMPCYKEMVESFRKTCFNINKNTYAMKHMYKFVNLCHSSDANSAEMVKILSVSCNNAHRSLNGIN